MLTQPHIIVGRIHAVHTVASLKLIALATRGERSAGKHRTFLLKTSSPRLGNVEKLKYIEKSKLEEMGQQRNGLQMKKKEKNPKYFIFQNDII